MVAAAHRPEPFAPDRYNPFSDSPALVDAPVSRRGLSVPLFIDPEDARLVEASAHSPGQAWLSSSDASEASEDEPSSDEAEMR